MKTSINTVGYCGGFSATNGNACSVRQHQTGDSICIKQTENKSSLAYMPRLKKLGVCAFFGLCMTGIVPMFLAAWLIMAAEAFGAWVLAPVCASVLVLVAKVMKHYG